jgi:hypothetical protein
MAADATREDLHVDALRVILPRAVPPCAMTGDLAWFSVVQERALQLIWHRISRRPRRDRSSASNAPWGGPGGRYTSAAQIHQIRSLTRSSLGLRLSLRNRARMGGERRSSTAATMLDDACSSAAAFLGRRRHADRSPHDPAPIVCSAPATLAFTTRGCRGARRPGMGDSTRTCVSGGAPDLSWECSRRGWVPTRLVRRHAAAVAPVGGPMARR